MGNSSGGDSSNIETEKLVGMIRDLESELEDRGVEFRAFKLGEELSERDRRLKEKLKEEVDRLRKASERMERAKKRSEASMDRLGYDNE